LRAFIDGMVSVVLPLYLLTRGYSPARIGVFITATLLGSAAVTLAVGLRGHRVERTTVLRAMALLMAVTGVLFSSVTHFWPLLVVAALGTLNPSSGDVSVFLATEQALLPATVDERHRTALFARYSFVGFGLAALGAGAAVLPDGLRQVTGWQEGSALRSVFVLYAAVGLVLWWGYRRLEPGLGGPVVSSGAALGPSRSIVVRLTGLFALDAFGGGFVVQAMLVLWLRQRHGLSTATTGVLFFWAGLASAGSALLAPRLAARIGLVRTMVFTHLPANAFLVLAAVVPSAPLAVTFLLARALLSQMDVPARTSYVMAVVTPAERAAAASVTNVPRSLATALSPLLAGWMLTRSTFGWPLVLGGVIKAVYDLALLAMFREVRPPEERPA
jgi:MFS family permease